MGDGLGGYGGGRDPRTPFGDDGSYPTLPSEGLRSTNASFQSGIGLGMGYTPSEGLRSRHSSRVGDMSMGLGGSMSEGLFSPPNKSLHETGRKSRGKATKGAAPSPHTPALTPIPKTKPAETSGIYARDPEIKHDNHVFKMATGANDCTVRVFGFPSNRAQAVVAEFQRVGEIVRRSDGGGNWMDIEFTSPFVVEAALTMNGKVIADGIMIGVMRVEPRGRASADPMNYRTPMTRKRIAYTQRRQGVYKLYRNFSAFWNYFQFGSWWWWDRWDSYSSGEPVPQSICSKVMEYILQW